MLITVIGYPVLYKQVSNEVSSILSLGFLVSTVPFECLHNSKNYHFYPMLFAKTAGPIGITALGALYYAAKRFWLKMLYTDTAEFEEINNKLHAKCMEAFFIITYVVFVPGR